jgi:hypothetical protein
MLCFLATLSVLFSLIAAQAADKPVEKQLGAHRQVRLSATQPNAPRQDSTESPSSTPAGMVAFFTAESCPTGWTVAEIAQGRLLVALTDSTESESLGEPMADKTALTHQHNYSATLVRSRRIASINYDPTIKAAKYQEKVEFEDTTRAAGMDLPFIQLLACRKD